MLKISFHHRKFVDDLSMSCLTFKNVVGYKHWCKEIIFLYSYNSSSRASQMISKSSHRVKYLRHSRGTFMVFFTQIET